MKILWSPDLSLAGPSMNLWGPQLVRSLEGDDLASYCAARLLTPEIDIFTPSLVGSGASELTYDDDGIPVLDDVDFETSPWLMGMAYFGALERIYEAFPEALVVLLDQPEALPSDVVSSYMGWYPDPSQQERVHMELAAFVRSVADALPGSGQEPPFFLTGSAMLGRLYVETQPNLTAQNTLALLATSGIDFILPRVAGISKDGLDELRDRLTEERASYLEALNDIISASYEALKAGDVEEAYRFAEMKVGTRLASECSKFERATGRLGGTTLRRLGTVVIDGVPSIARDAVLAPQNLPMDVGKTVLSALLALLGRKRAPRELAEQYPLGSYAYRIRRELSS